MTRAWPVMPGCPAAGHLTGGGAWHPGRIDGCVKCPQPRRRQPIDPELFRRTAPRWNCIAYPDGMHYQGGPGGTCQWCGAQLGPPRAPRVVHHDDGCTDPRD